MSKIKIGNKEFTVRRFRLKKWLELEEILARIREAVDTQEIADGLLDYVSTAFDIDKETLRGEFWFDIANAVLGIHNANQPSKDFPILRNVNKKQQPRDDLDYKGRSWYFWCHLIARAYGWTIKQIEFLDIDDAIALIQEILIEKYQEREWQWSLSELAYSFDVNTKTSKYHSLPKPEWMAQKKEEPKPSFRLPKTMIPVGIIVRGNIKDNIQ